jgi:hypothetical protein
MATLTWQYFLTGNLPPGTGQPVTVGPSDALKGASFAVTAHPTTNLRRTYFWLTAAEVSIGNYDIGTGDIDNVQTSLWFRVQNNGLAGQGTVRSYAVYVTRNTP